MDNDAFLQVILYAPLKQGFVNLEETVYVQIVQLEGEGEMARG